MHLLRPWTCCPVLSCATLLPQGYVRRSLPALFEGALEVALFPRQDAMAMRYTDETKAITVRQAGHAMTWQNVPST